MRNLNKNHEGNADDTRANDAIISLRVPIYVITGVALVLTNGTTAGSCASQRTNSSSGSKRDRISTASPIDTSTSHSGDGGGGAGCNGGDVDANDAKKREGGGGGDDSASASAADVDDDDDDDGGGGSADSDGMPLIDFNKFKSLLALGETGRERLAQMWQRKENHHQHCK
jgi:hypothetical protein